MATKRKHIGTPIETTGVAIAMVVLAIGFVAGFVIFCVAVFYDAVNSEQPGLSENATQVLTGWGGGIVGILGAFVGYRAGHPGQSIDSSEEESQPVAPPGVAGESENTGTKGTTMSDPNEKKDRERPDRERRENDPPQPDTQPVEPEEVPEENSGL